MEERAAALSTFFLLQPCAFFKIATTLAQAPCIYVMSLTVRSYCLIQFRVGLADALLKRITGGPACNVTKIGFVACSYFRDTVVFVLAKGKEDAV